MKHLLKIASGINVTPLRLQLHRNPGLWNRNPQRTQSPTSPHHGVDDIWVRYAADASDSSPHDSVWLEAAKYLPAVHDIVFGLMGLVAGERLGGVLITRIPPGRKVLPHSDTGWHAQYYDKIAVQIAAHPQQTFNYDDGAFHAMPGDVYWFNNQATHWVDNPSPVERITMIVCIKPHTPLNNLQKEV